MHPVDPVRPFPQAPSRQGHVDVDQRSIGRIVNFPEDVRLENDAMVGQRAPDPTKEPGNCPIRPTRAVNVYDVRAPFDGLCYGIIELR
jgi:hypothetical protein